MKRILLILIMCLAAASQAHDLLVDTVRVVVTSTGTYVSVGLHRGDKLAGHLDQQIRERLTLKQGGHPLSFGKPTINPSVQDDMVYWQAPVTNSRTGDFTLDQPIRPEVQGMTTALLVFQHGDLVAQHAYKSATKPEPMPAPRSSSPWMLVVGTMTILILAISAIRSWIRS